MKKLLITGGLGNLGSWITAHFAKQGYEVFVLTKNSRTLTEKHHYKLIFADIGNLASLKEADLTSYGFEYVIHTASVNDGFVDDYPHIALQVNALGTRNLLEVIKEMSIKHFVYFSTFQVYGKYDGTITEDTPTLPKHDYGTTHLFAEIYVKQFHKTHQLPFTILRLTNSYGCPKDYNSSKWYLVLNDLSKSAFENKEIVLKSNGKAPRDFIWMGSVAQMVEDLLNLETVPNDIYNVSGEETIQILDVAEEVQKAYQTKYGQTISILTNEEDKTTYPTDLVVKSDRIRKLVQIKKQKRFQEEAIRIFEMLESKSD